MKHDVAIIGGGVAGLTMALSLPQKQLSVVVIERTDYNALRVGEHLPPDTRDLLCQLGLWQRFSADEHLPCPGVRSAWGSEKVYEKDYIFSPYGSGWNLDRRSFDNALAHAVEDSGATILCGARLASLARTSAGWSVEIDVEGRRQVFTASFLVDATGRSSAISRKLGAKRIVHDQQQALIAWLSADEATECWDATLLIEAVEDGWWYATPLPNNRLVAAFMTDPPLFKQSPVPLNQLWSEKLHHTSHIRKRLDGYKLIDVCVRPANSYRMDKVANDGWMAVGDAAMAFDPLSSMGISKALSSGLTTANVVECYLKGDAEALDEYAADIAWEFVEYLVKRTAYYRLEMRWPEQPFWRWRHTIQSSRAITLDPQNLVQAGSDFVENLTGLGLAMTQSDLRKLRNICRTPLPAHHVVSRFKEVLSRPMSDERIIYSIQAALQDGVLEHLSG